ncbi:helicase-exonuclease AddAB subunit AddB [Cytobacillus gottheilii]|uniref:helicase-exonuclease AddAB subunit AddB n=1 Tax=Cytobacillus gottheilii TaxID=859144 RepID=UPI00249591AE|nr:helicase-exonuclease AddAB subunit AddB [Cytobacillus gottheilii]
MSVRMIMGRSGSGKTELCLSEIRQKLESNPEGNPIIYLVPEQMTFQSEYNILANPNINGMIRTQVYSFTRLAWRILQETGGISRQHLNSTGISMLIRKLIEDHKEELHIFQKAADKNGFIKQMETMMTEFKRYCINAEELSSRRQHLQENNEINKALNDKLHDLEVIYRSFEESLSGKYVDSEDYFSLLSEKAAQSDYLKNSEVYVDGFYRFTPQEYLVLEQLMKHCKKVTITMTMDDHQSRFRSELSLFRMSNETYETIEDISNRLGLDVEEVVLSQQKRWISPAIQHVEAQFETRPNMPFSGYSDVHLAQAVNRRAEIEGVARRMKQLARQGQRYKDMAVLVRNGNEYHDIMETVFTDYEIPFFIDQKRTMLNHPLIELIRSSLEVLYGNWRYEPVFRAVKTELLFPAKLNQQKLREQMDRLENYVLAYGIQGSKWTGKSDWTYRRFRGLELENIAQTDAEKQIERELNELRDYIAQPIARMGKRMKKATDGRGYCEAIYLYLEELAVPEKLEKWAAIEEEKGNLIKAREHNQAWSAVIELLDQFVEMLGNEEVALQKFASILEAGMESLQFSLVPPAIDQVIVADMERSRLSNIKTSFVIGLNEGVLPAKFPEDGVLADQDREALLAAGMKIAPSTRTKLLDEEFIAYKAFVSSSEELYISYPLATEEGKALLPSPYIKKFTDTFPEMQEDFYMADPFELPEEKQAEYAAGYQTALTFLTSQLQLKKRNYHIYDLWWDVYNLYMESDQWRETAGHVLESLTYENRTENLSEDMTKELYGDHILASVSRMELYHSCPFSHFAQHGLKLRERQIFRLDAPDIGELFHAALKYIAETISVKKMAWDKLTRDQFEILAKEAVELLAPKLQNEILLSSNRHYYIKRKLEQIITRASFILGEHAKVSGFAPVGLELGFGPKAELPSMTFPLKNGVKMELVGRIDRVDKAEDDQGIFLRVIDYKSSSKDLNVNEVYYGLAMQMLTYLDIIIAHSETLVGNRAFPAGVLYFHVHNPMLAVSKMLKEEDLEQEFMKKFKMQGLMLGEENVIRLMDQSIDNSDSAIVSAGFKKDGSISKKSKIASKQEFDSLRSFVRRKYIHSGNEIMSGNVHISPYKLKEQTPCTFCEYKSVCQFDDSIESNSFRLLNTQSKEEVLDRIKKEVDEHENNDTA